MDDKIRMLSKLIVNNQPKLKKIKPKLSILPFFGFSANDYSFEFSNAFSVYELFEYNNKKYNVYFLECYNWLSAIEIVDLETKEISYKIFDYCFCDCVSILADRIKRYRSTDFINYKEEDIDFFTKKILSNQLSS